MDSTCTAVHSSPRAVATPPAVSPRGRNPKCLVLVFNSKAHSLRARRLSLKLEQHGVVPQSPAVAQLPLPYSVRA
jgi:hypothetical protein